MTAAAAALPRRPNIVRWAIVASVGSLVALGLVAGLLMRGGDSTGSSDTVVGSGKIAPAFSLPDVNDSSVQVTLPEGKPTVLYFFASWCVPCRREAPIVQSVASSRSDVTFVGVDHLDQIDDARDFMKKYGVTIRAGHDPGGDVARKYGLLGLPATVFIDADGRIASTKLGELKRKTLEERIDALVLQGSPD